MSEEEKKTYGEEVKAPVAELKPPVNGAPEKPKLAAARLQNLITDLKADPQQGYNVAAKTAENLSDDATEKGAQIFDTFEALFKLFENIDTAWSTLLAAFKGKLSPEEITSYTKGKELEQKEKKQPAKAKPESWDEQGEKMSYNAYSRAEHAKDAVDTHTEWRRFIKESSDRHGVPTATIAAIIEMESSFDPNKETGASIGFGQAQPDAKNEFEAWLLTRPDVGMTPPVNMKDPRVGIEFVAFYVPKVIGDVNSIISKEGIKEGYKPTYAVNEKNPGNVWLAYTCGPTGYLKLRRYLDSLKTEDKAAQEVHFQKLPDSLRANVKFRGREMFRWDMNRQYAKEITEVAGIYRSMEKDPSKVSPIDFPPLGRTHRYSMSSGFGHRRYTDKQGHTHEGHHAAVDYPAPTGTPVYAVKRGVVRFAKANNGDAGNHIILFHDTKNDGTPDGTTSQYMHLSVMNITQGQVVEAGQKIGEVGETGHSTNPHLHFVYKDQRGRPVNPEVVVANAVGRN